MSHKSIRAALIVSGSAALLFVAACSDESTTHTDHSTVGTSVTSTSLSVSAGAQHNSADIMFNQMMIPHHAQAVEMAELVTTRTDNAQVRRLAAAISSAQQPEIDAMTARLKAWGQPTETAGGHGGHRMTGMMSDADMTELKAARTAEFDHLWLKMMVRHHEGAVSMANAVLTDGVDADTHKLATAIKAAQQREIAEMNALLK